MIGIDTNILVRYITQDDPVQARCANSVIDSLTEDSPGYITSAVAVELYWVLTKAKAYRYPPKDALRAMRTVLSAREIELESGETILEALSTAEDTGADFGDALIAAAGRLAGCRYTATFDRSAAAKVGMRLLDG
ncbi:PIN domain-containing protein [Salininema proteolyticum]|uniref:PIN domain-containing protein n=1 Tax=Salininema proteolyticum TaxID=1607685 RepID=A0ABV8U1U9_9ACTN